MMVVLLLSLYWTFFKIGLFTFGGGYAMIPLMKEEVITRHGWLTATEFLDVIAIAEMTPGPVSINAATFIGFQTAGVVGSLTATLGVITPSLVLLLLLSRILFRLIRNPRAENFLQGLRAAFVALIFLAAFSLGQLAIIDVPTIIIFISLFIANLFLSINPIYFITTGAILGLIFFPF
ncbi:MAG TPA: chromate transporter [Candidatus Limnocylindrales bacterium]|nr:chromate transporter [Candidatus Limnocylindrales bacterium]